MKAPAGWANVKVSAGDVVQPGDLDVGLSVPQRAEVEQEILPPKIARHGEFLQRYRAKDWDAAEALRRECDTINTAGLHQLYALYRERIAFLRQNPPPPDWDGTAEALGK